MCTKSKSICQGKPLASRLRRFFEDRFASDLRTVRIHTGGYADFRNRRQGSLAFAAGEEIFFRRGAFAPQTRGGLWLLAHELAHVQQQRGSRSARVLPRRVQALEREASAAASAVLDGRRIVVPPREGCPAVQRWDIDMHFTAVYWAGRVQTANHDTALRVALASQSLDDSEEKSAPGLKIKGRSMLFGDPGPNNTSLMAVRRANNSHALGLTSEESERVAMRGVREDFDLLFGLGLHSVGDFLPHANLSGLVSFGHGNQKNENCTDSAMFAHDADDTSKNPHKAMDTLQRFMKLWATFRQLKTIVPLAPLVKQAMAEFAMAQDQATKELKFTLGAELAGIKKAHIADVIMLWNAEHYRHLIWENNDVLNLKPDLKFIPDQSRRAEAETKGAEFWLSRPNDSFFRKGVDVEALKRQGAFGLSFGGYPAVIPPSAVCPTQDGFLATPPYGVGR